ncbi:MAG: L-piperidine-6-carboxylate dehydrogenase [Ilumatobacteraceae bacterium]
MDASDTFDALGLEPADLSGGGLAVTSPIDGSVLAELAMTDASQVDGIVARSSAAFEHWRTVPAPRRGELVRLLGEELRNAKQDLGRLVALEAGKITQEGEGEVQEMIDVCDYALGLSRQLYGLTIASERPGHSMRETWHPLGPTLVITAFNFPVAVWSWNAALALVCGNPVVWKPSEKSPLTAMAVMNVFRRALDRFGDDAPADLVQMAVGDRDIGEALVAHPGLPVVSATGSTRMGRGVAGVVAQRFGRAILELGGNNAMIVAPSADLDLAVRAIVFSAVGTAGQRCTTLRRLIVHDDVYDELMPRLRAAYATLPIGDPLDPATLVGPLVDGWAYAAMRAALDRAAADGGVVTGGERVRADEAPDAFYVEPAIVEMPTQTELVTEETFAPLLYVMRYQEFSDALALNNAVPQGLASSLFTTDVRESEQFTTAVGSDCGIANVNIGPSGAEIGGAFGGEKETGGGRESGSDAWRGYMRRQTNTINYGRDLPLAQGISFDLAEG